MANKNYRNYRTYSEPETEAKEIENAIVNDADTEEVTDTDMPAQIEGTVKDCVRLNVREAPSIDSSVRCEIPADTKLHVDVLGSTKDWLEVRLDDGTCGFVMANYVECDHLFDVG